MDILIKFKSMPVLIGVVLFLSSFSFSSAGSLRKAGIVIDSVTLSGPNTISKGSTQNYSVNYRVKRIKEGNVDPGVKDVTIGVSLIDRDGWFRGGDDLLSHNFITIPRGTLNNFFNMSTRLQLMCTSKKKIRGVGSVPYGNRKSGEKEAEVFAEVNGITIRKIKKVKCVK